MTNIAMENPLQMDTNGVSSWENHLTKTKKTRSSIWKTIIFSFQHDSRHLHGGIGAIELPAR